MSREEKKRQQLYSVFSHLRHLPNLQLGHVLQRADDPEVGRRQQSHSRGVLPVVSVRAVVQADRFGGVAGGVGEDGLEGGVEGGLAVEAGGAFVLDVFGDDAL